MEKKLWTSLDDKIIPQRSAVSHANRKNGKGDSLEEILDDKTLNTSSSRRDFLKLFGFSIASAAVVASCEQPVRKAIPYLIKPEEITPGKASYYASTYYDGQQYGSVLVKVRDGRPIKIEGNTLSSINKGGTTARIQASVLSLYDEARYKVPLINKNESSWSEFDDDVRNTLKKLSDDGKEIALITPSIISPATRKVINGLQASYPTLKQFQYDAASASGMLKANELTFGLRSVPSYRFDKAEMIVSFGADFLGTWISPAEFTKQYVTNRSLTEGQKKLSKHVQLEACMSLTGSNADQRILMKPSQEKLVLANLYNEVASLTGDVTYKAPASPIPIEELAHDLYANNGKSLVVSGSNDPSVQLIVNAINNTLGNYGNTIDLSMPYQHLQGDDEAFSEFTTRLAEGQVGGVIFWDVNPVYDHPAAERIKSGMKQTAIQIAISNQYNETADVCSHIAPDHHYLESWNDAEIKPGVYSLTQPTIHPLFNTRQGAESLLVWSGSDQTYHDLIKSYWQSEMLAKSNSGNAFSFWNTCLHDGVFEVDSSQRSSGSLNRQALAIAFTDFELSDSGFELSLYEKTGVGRGMHTNNPWLQEMPDPVSKATWDNYLNVSPADAEAQGWKTGDIVSLNENIELPVLVQPGQAPGTVSAALGYGRTVSGVVAMGVGINTSGLIAEKSGIRLFYQTGIQITKTGTGYQIAQTQTHHSMEGRAIIRSSPIAEYLKNPAAGNELHEEIEKKHTTIYKEHEYKGHHWGMAIDLNKCVGCSACVVACSAENNVPVVGKNEVLRAHEMHWIRIDRYYEGEADNPTTYRQPVMCQHCDNAPCENVCPVAATNHSDEGINQMAYNRCIGTRYCNNNCPYKVRRFNWFDYTTADALKGNTFDPANMTLDLKRMVLNPDVTVRAKGVIEKCSFCVQRIQEKKLTAKLENRALADGEIVPACQQSCPADAIVFGDMNNPESKVSRFFADKRNYHLLEELHVLPSVGYLTKITNTEEA